MGNVTDDVWKKYVEDQKPESPDDHFKVVQAYRPNRPIDPLYCRNSKPPALAGGVFTSNSELLRHQLDLEENRK